MPQPPSYMTPFSRIDYKDISIDFLKQKNKLGYTFQYEGRNYGNKVEVDKKNEKAIVEATATLIVNAINSYEELRKDGKGENNKPCPVCGEKSTIPGVDYLPCSSHK